MCRSCAVVVIFCSRGGEWEEGRKGGWSEKKKGRVAAFFLENGKNVAEYTGRRNERKNEGKSKMAGIKS